MFWLEMGPPQSADKNRAGLRLYGLIFSMLPAAENKAVRVTDATRAALRSHVHPIARPSSSETRAIVTRSIGPLMQSCLAVSERLDGRRVSHLPQCIRTR